MLAVSTKPRSWCTYTIFSTNKQVKFYISSTIIIGAYFAVLLFSSWCVQRALFASWRTKSMHQHTSSFNDAREVKFGTFGGGADGDHNLLDFVMSSIFVM